MIWNDLKRLIINFSAIENVNTFHAIKMRTRTISTAFFATAHYTHLAKNAVGSFATFQMEIKTAQIVLFRTNEKIIRQLHHDSLFSRLADTGFDGAVLIEAYKDDYKEIAELIKEKN